MKTEKNIILELTRNELIVLKTALYWSSISTENERNKKEINKILNKLE